MTWSKRILLVLQFCKAIYKWVISGRETRTIREINLIYDTICTRCKCFSNDTCIICDCNIKRDTKWLNKIALKNEVCPCDPPKWT